MPLPGQLPTLLWQELSEPLHSGLWPHPIVVGFAGGSPPLCQPWEAGEAWVESRGSPQQVEESVEWGIGRKKERVTLELDDFGVAFPFPGPAVNLA